MAPSERTFAATAALIGMAMFAFTSDIAARSGSSSPASCSSSSFERLRYSCSGISCGSFALVGLVEIDVLLGVRVGDGVVARDVQGDGCVDRRCHVRVDQRHGGPLRQFLAGHRLELFTCELLVLGHSCLTP